MAAVKPLDRFAAGLPAITSNINRPDRWPNLETARRPRRVYRLLFWVSTFMVTVFLAIGGLSLILLPPLAMALISLAGWSMAYAFAEGYRDGAKHAVDDAAALAKESMQLPVEIEKELWAVQASAGKGQGHLYVVEFETGAIKVGQSRNPMRRIDEHHRDAWAYNVVVTNAWVSKPHQAYLTNEIKLMSAVAKLGGGRAKREYFHGVDFERVVGIATELASRPTPARLRRPSTAAESPPAPAPATPVPVGPPAH